MPITVTVSETGEGPFTQTINASGHISTADEPQASGGTNAGPSPYDLLLSALGACTSMTLRMYANQKGWDLKRVQVTLTHKKETDADNRKQDVISREITLDGILDNAQRLKL